ncbi:MAG: RNA 2',3'-cyclic phosphodiesterase [Candidatus Eisenbacteria sp.]|nr:RNA 2',3'-cyclic phosphodiesterase [Candidatus Eisenbacteria bacterium]
MEAIRTFVALRLPSWVQKTVAEVQNRIHVPGIRVRWVEPENFHLSLRFLGDMPVDRLESVYGAVEKGCAGVRAFEVSLEGIGAFPNLRRPRVIWVGLERGREEVARLAASIEDCLEEVGFAREERPFKAHATLGRVKDFSPAVRMLGERAAAQHLEIDGIRVTRIEVMKSQLTRQGPIYTVLREVALVGGEGSE